MSEPFVAEIRMFAGNFAPTGWATCDGQLMPISQNTALFSLLGTYYGGDGKSTFALPNMDGNAPMHQGQGQGLSQRFIGESAGTESITLIQTEVPVHTHVMSEAADVARFTAPAGMVVGSGNAMFAAPSNNMVMAAQTLSVAGGSLPHNNMQPYLAVTFIIALQGVFPPRG